MEVSKLEYRKVVKVDTLGGRTRLVIVSIVSFTMHQRRRFVLQEEDYLQRHWLVISMKIQDSMSIFLSRGGMTHRMQWLSSDGLGYEEKVCRIYVHLVQVNQLFRARNPSPGEGSNYTPIRNNITLNVPTKENARLIFYEARDSHATTLEQHRDSIRARLTGLMNT